MNIISDLKNDILDTITTSFKLEKENRRNIVLNLNTEKEDFGDLSCNAALILSKALKMSPRDISDKIKNILITKFSDFIEEIEIAGPGFLNIYLKKEVWVKVAGELFKLKRDFYKLNQIDSNKKYLVEFVSANPTGPLHLGHGRNGIIGDVLSNVLKFLGHETVKEFYINDAGSQIKKLGECFKIRCQQELGLNVELPEDGYAGLYLKDLAKECVIQFGEDLLQKPDSFFADYAKDNMLEKIKMIYICYKLNFIIVQWVEFARKCLYNFT